MMTAYPILVVCVVAIGASAIGQDLSTTPLQIQGAKVASESDAKRIAFKCYVNKMRINVLATEVVRQLAIIRLGYDMPKFAAKGDKIWEARVGTQGGELRAILWVNPNAEEVYYVIGPWNSERQE